MAMTKKPENKPTRGKGEKKAPRASPRAVNPAETASAPVSTASSRQGGAVGGAVAGSAAAPRAERIAKVLARAGVASRRDAERMIVAGRVTLNGERLTSPAVTVVPEDAILVDGRPVAEPEPPRLWRYHKPNGLVTTARDEKGRDTIFDHLPPGLPRVLTIGRLDLTSEGLLLLTNDGELKRRLELPQTGWLRRYRVRVHGRPTEAALRPLEQGISVDGEQFQPMLTAIERQQGANAWITLGLKEGKNREIRRAMEAVGFTVNRLIRIGYGPFRLGDLPAGAVEEVRTRVLREQLGLEVETPAARERRARAAPERAAGGGGVDNGANDTSGRQPEARGRRPRNRP